MFKVDVVGRIGGFMSLIQLTLNSQDTFKKPLTPEEETTVVYDIDITDLYGTKAEQNYKGLAASSQ